MNLLEGTSDREPSDEIRACVRFIVNMANHFEDEGLPDFAVGAIEGWCKRLLRVADKIQHEKTEVEDGWG